MRKSGEKQVVSRVGQEKIAEQLILARMKAEQMNTIYHEQPSRETFKELKKAVNRLHRLTMTKWHATSEVSPPSFIFERDENNEKQIKSFLDDLSADQMQQFLDRVGVLYEKMNLHGYMKEQAGDVGLGGKDAAQKAQEKAEEKGR